MNLIRVIQTLQRLAKYNQPPIYPETIQALAVAIEAVNAILEWRKQGKLPYNSYLPGEENPLL